MGNYISCTLLAAKHGEAAKVLFPTGEIRQYKQTIQAAEIMFEMPNYFLTNANSLKIGRRFSPLNADEDLEIGSVYSMFSMQRLNSMVAAGDLGALFLMAKRTSFGSHRVLPECSEVLPIAEQFPKSETCVLKLNLDDIEEYSMPEFQQKRYFCRSKKPFLETIAEEPFSSR